MSVPIYPARVVLSSPGPNGATPVGDATTPLVVSSAVAPVSTTSSGFSKKRCPTSALLLATAQTVKITAGKVFGIRVLNPNATKAYVKFYNALIGDIVVGTTVPVMVLEVPANDGTNDGQLIITPDKDNELEHFSTAISVLATIVHADTGAQTAPAAGLLVDAIQYA